MCKKCDARAELLFCLLNLMFRDTVASLDLKVPIDVVELTIHRVYQVLNDRTGMRYRKQCLQDLPTRLSQLPRGARATFLDVRSLLSRSLEQAVLDFAKPPM